MDDFDEFLKRKFPDRKGESPRNIEWIQTIEGAGVCLQADRLE